MKKIIITTTVIQIVIIVFLGYQIYGYKNKIKGAYVVNPMSKNNYVFYESDGLKYFYEPKPNTVENEGKSNFPNPTYTINSDSLNEIRDYEKNVSPWVYRIITLGDSFTYGMFMNTQDNWTELLENMLNQKLSCNSYNKFEVINLGVKGYDINYSVQRYKLRGIKYDPDLIVWLLKEDDINYDNEMLQGIVWGILEELKENGAYEQYKQQGEYYPEWQIAKQRAYANTTKTQTYNTQYENLKRLDKLYSKALIITTFSNTPKDEEKLFKKYLNERENRSYYFNTLADPEKEKDLFFPKDGHPTKDGHREIAQRLFTYIVDNNIIPCN